ncbi:winged helix-turn-helix domain-containing protein [Megalodesulfovibrio paquesii]
MDTKTPVDFSAALATMQIRAHVWLERDGEVLLGPGRAMLLERIDQMGSLRKAAQSMHISYRSAWGKIKKTEVLLGQALVEKTGYDRSGYSLTSFGKTVLQFFLAVQGHVNVEAARQARAFDGAREMPSAVAVGDSASEEDGKHK